MFFYRNEAVLRNMTILLAVKTNMTILQSVYLLYNRCCCVCRCFHDMLVTKFAVYDFVLSKQSMDKKSLLP